MSNHITAPVRAYGNRAGCIGCAFVAVGLLVGYVIYAYTIPETYAQGGTALDIFGTALLGWVVLFLVFGLGGLGLLTMLNSHKAADQADQYTDYADGQWYEDDYGQRHPGSLTIVTDDGVYVQVGTRRVRVHPLSDYELMERRVANEGGFSGYNEAVNGGRK